MFKKYPQPRRVSLFAGLAILAGTMAGGPLANAADRSGKEVVEMRCAECHVKGTDGAPRIGNTAEWAPRAREGMARLLQSSMEGVRKMPAHGGQANLTDLEMTRAINYMLSGGKTPDPKKPFTAVAHGTGAQIVASACGTCHKEGLNGAPKIGDTEAWMPRLPKGIDELVKSAVNGHNKMPARGGFGTLSDVNIRAAVSYMASQAPAKK